jgi:hypothetical protein
MMPRGRAPEGEAPLSNAERQARYRARHKEAQPAVTVRTLRPVSRRGRIRRWCDAVAELVDIQAGCAAWLDAMPESLRGTATAEALEAITDLDLEVLAAVLPPRGYGRD